MITFITLFVSLVAGPQEIEVSVAPGVAQVELFLDGRSLGSRSQPPWRWSHDFGIHLAPRELKAVARDAEGEELDQARQLLNIPAARAGASLVVEGTADRRWARLSWKTVEDQEPQSLEVWMDGGAVAVADPSRIDLPPADPQVLHLMTAKIVFPDGAEARAWATFGGSYGDHEEAKVTAVPLRVASPDAGLKAEDLRGKLRARGKPLEVLALEKGPAQILLVRAPDTSEALRRLGMGENVRGNDEPVTDPLRHMPRFLGRRDQFNVLSTWTRGPAGDRGKAGPPVADASLFSLLINDRRLLQAGLPTILTRGFAPVPDRARHRLADAVAAAGRAAAADRQPRAVILVVGGNTKDHSVYSAQQVRRYLSMLRVPLTVWHIPTRRGQKPPRDWQGAIDISTPIRLREALHSLRNELDLQRIVWVEGAHLPQEIQPSAPGASFEMLE